MLFDTRFLQSFKIIGGGGGGLVPLLLFIQTWEIINKLIMAHNLN